MLSADWMVMFPLLAVAMRMQPMAPYCFSVLDESKMRLELVNEFSMSGKSAGMLDSVSCVAALKSERSGNVPHAPTSTPMFVSGPLLFASSCAWAPVIELGCCQYV